MTPDELKAEVDGIIEHSRDDERAHAEEDELHLKLIEEFCPPWVQEQVLDRLLKAPFARWYA